ncbi:MAG TPA: PepSY-associated TM helix domain-containing protein [Balneolaceae bacterium]|nr:PepSY-associated TM helix domain-containing protein [Balneolaceae bacterium]
MRFFKKIILFLHRWLGLISGLVVFILGVTGCLFVFQHEISQWTRSEVLFIEQEHASETLPVKELQQKAAQALDVEYLPYGLTTYKNPDRNWSVMSYKGGGDSWTYFGTIKDYRTLYINPYSGDIAGIVNEEQDFFQIVKGIHWSLLLATPIGQPITVWSTVVFIILLISGIVLWWPKKWNKSGKQKSFKIKWGGTWRRLNYDLHNVLGFYFLVISLILGLTGLYWYFPFAQKSLHFLGTGEFKLPALPAAKVVSVPGDDKNSSALDVAYSKAWNEYPRAFSITIAAPFDSAGTIRATVRPDGDTYYANSTLQFDQYTGKLLAANRYSELNAGEKLLSMNYDIHVGAIAGLPGKIIAFLASLICASLPVTGFLIWWDREKRKKKAAKKKKRPRKVRERKQEEEKEEALV